MTTEKVDRPFYKLYAWQALLAWGEQAQLDMVVEECLELVLAIQDYKRGRLKNPKESITNEIADVLLMTGQLREMFLISGKELEEKQREKVVRLGVRIDMAETKANST